MEINIFNFKSADGTEVFDAAFNELGYLNATEAYQFFGKPQSTFDNWKTRTLVPYAEMLIELGKIPEPQIGVLPKVSDLIVVRVGGNQSKHEAGTWLHPKLAIVFARWIKLEFEIWCDEKISELISNGTVTLQPEDQEWVDYIEDLSDFAPGSRRYMENIRQALLVHEKEGYNIKAFKDLVEYVKDTTNKDNRSKVLKKLRQLIKEMYEAGKLSRTSHELMLEFCNDTVVEVLEKEIKTTKRQLRLAITKFTLPTKPSDEIDIPALTKQQAVEHNTTVEVGNKPIDAVALYGHKIFSLSMNPFDGQIPIFTFGAKVSVADCRCLIAQSGLKVVFSGTLYPKRYDASDKAPALSFRDGMTGNQIAIWFNEGTNYASCSITKRYKQGDIWESKSMFDLSLQSLVSTDPYIWTGYNKLNTMRVVVSTMSNFFLVYGK